MSAPKEIIITTKLPRSLRQHLAHPTPTLWTTPYMLVRKRARLIVMGTPYRQNGNPNRKAQALLRKLKRRGGWYSLPRPR